MNRPNTQQIEKQKPKSCLKKTSTLQVPQNKDTKQTSRVGRTYTQENKQGGDLIPTGSPLATSKDHSPRLDRQGQLIAPGEKYCVSFWRNQKQPPPSVEEMKKKNKKKYPIEFAKPRSLSLKTAKLNDLELDDIKFSSAQKMSLNSPVNKSMLQSVKKNGEQKPQESQVKSKKTNNKNQKSEKSNCCSIQ